MVDLNKHSQCHLHGVIGDIQVGVISYSDQAWEVSCFRLVLFLQPAYHRESMLVLVQQISLYGVCRAVSILKKKQ